MLASAPHHPCAACVCNCSTCASRLSASPFFFFFNDTATTEIYTLSLHDALPILLSASADPGEVKFTVSDTGIGIPQADQDRKSTRLNSSHLVISYAVFCLKKKTISTAEPPAPICTGSIFGETTRVDRRLPTLASA